MNSTTTGLNIYTVWEATITPDNPVSQLVKPVVMDVNFEDGKRIAFYLSMNAAGAKFYTTRRNEMQGPVYGYFLRPTGETIPDWYATPASRFEVYNSQTGTVISKPVTQALAQEIAERFSTTFEPVFAVRRVEAS